MTRRVIQLIAAGALTCLAAVAVISAASPDRPSRSPFGESIGTDQYMTVDLGEEPPPPAALARADGPAGRSRSFAARIGDFVSRFRGAPTRASRKLVRVESPAAVRLTRSASVASGRTGNAPAKATTAVNAQIGCHFLIWDEDGEYYDWSYDVRIFDPNNNQIHAAQNWISNKPGYSSYAIAHVTDPDEGIYTCKIQWWVEEYALPEEQEFKPLTYLVPTGETTIGNAWSGSEPTAYKWRGRLTGGNFVGRQVLEAEGGGDVDTCWWPGSEKAKAVGLTILDPWEVGEGSEYGDDTVGWLWEVVDYYRTTPQLPCQSETDQIMKVNRPGASWVAYKTNRLKMGNSSGPLYFAR